VANFALLLKLYRPKTTNYILSRSVQLLFWPHGWRTSFTAISARSLTALVYTKCHIYWRDGMSARCTAGPISVGWVKYYNSISSGQLYVTIR